jgi:hypothetical protein
MKTFMTISCMSLVFTAAAYAQSRDTGKGQGAIVITDGATVYKNSEGDEAYSKKLEKGYAVAGISTLARMVTSYQFEDENGRVHVFGIINGIAAKGWMNRADLSSYFSYECGCGLADAKCSPHVLERMHYKWSICFEEARDEKLADMQKDPSPAAAAPAATTESVETRLQKLNDLYKKGLITKEEYEKKRAQILESM